MINILVYHDLGAQSHYRALEACAKRLNAKVEYGEFAYIKKFYKDISVRKVGSIKRFLFNFSLYCKLLFGIYRPNVIVLGVAPFDWRIVLLIPIMRFSRIQLHTSWPHWNGTFNAMNPRVNWVIDVWKWFFKNKLEHVYFVTDTARTNCEAAGFLIKSYSIVQHSLDTSIYKVTTPPSDRKKVSIGYVGRLEEQKGIKILLEIARQLHSKGYDFYVAGSGELKDEVQECHSKGLLTYLGQITSQRELSDFYNKLNFILLPSLRASNWEELFGMVLIEAAACGVTPITTDHIGPIEVVKKLGFGLVYPEAHYESATLKYLANSSIDDDSSIELAERAAFLYSLQSLSKEWEKGILTV